MGHKLAVSSPKEAAKQGLKKMKDLMDLGLMQGVLPPQERPDIDALRRLGFCGRDAEVVERVCRDAPFLLTSAYSASSMWAANSATVSPSADTADHKAHFTPANLSSQFHRSLEPDMTGLLLRHIFRNETGFVHHPPLPKGSQLSDEGAANHTRFCGSFDEGGIELFVYGKRGFDPNGQRPTLYPARQTVEASEAIARLHRLDPERTLFAQQNPEVIDAGVFHNDVISVGNQNLFFYHSLAFVDTRKMIEKLKEKFLKHCGQEMFLIEVEPSQVSLEDAVKSYLFNSQLVTLNDESMLLISPEECRQNAKIQETIERIIREDNPIQNVRYVDIRQSMKNGGGPACLRLRVVLSSSERSMIHQPVLMGSRLYEDLLAWVNEYYRDQLHFSDLRDPNLIEESRTALDVLTQLLQLGSIYPFQRSGS
jgi:succinylarginine dihydrolase